MTDIKQCQKICSLSRNSCAKAICNVSRGKNFRQKILRVKVLIIVIDEYCKRLLKSTNTQWNYFFYHFFKLNGQFYVCLTYLILLNVILSCPSPYFVLRTKILKFSCEKISKHPRRFHFSWQQTSYCATASVEDYRIFFLVIALSV